MNDKLTRLWATKTKNDEWWSSFVTAPLAIALNYLVVDFKWLTPEPDYLVLFCCCHPVGYLNYRGWDSKFY